MNKKRAFLVGLIFFILAIVSLAPATLISQYLADKSAGRLLLSNAQGTIWQGSADVALAGEAQQLGVALANLSEVNISASNIGQLDWQIQATRLLVGQFKVVFSLNNSAPANLTLSNNQIKLEQLDINLPAAAIASLMPSLSVAQLGGQIHISTPSFTAEALNTAELNFTGQVQIAWLQARSALSAINPLGQYQTLINGQNQQLIIKLNTIDGALILQGDGSLNPTSGLVFSGVASAQTSQKQALAPLLHVLGNETVAGSGEFKINFNH